MSADYITAAQVWTSAAKWHRDQAAATTDELADCRAVGLAATSRGRWANAKHRATALEARKACHEDAATHFEQLASTAAFARG